MCRLRCEELVRHDCLTYKFHYGQSTPPNRSAFPLLDPTDRPTPVSRVGQLVLHALWRLGVQFAHRMPSNLAWDNSSFWPRGLRPGLQSPFSRRPQPFSAHTPVWLSFLNLRQNPFVIGLIAGGDKAPLNLHQNLLVIAGGHNNFGLLSSFLLRSSPSIISITDWVIGWHKN